MNWSGNNFPLTIRLRIKRPCSRILKLIQAIVFRINVLFILCTVLDVTNANLFEHYLNVLFMNLTINYIYSPSVVLSVEWCGPVLTIKAWVLSSIYHYSHQWSISQLSHSLFVNWHFFFCVSNPLSYPCDQSWTINRSLVNYSAESRLLGLNESRWLVDEEERKWASVSGQCWQSPPETPE